MFYLNVMINLSRKRGRTEPALKKKAQDQSALEDILNKDLKVGEKEELL